MNITFIGDIFPADESFSLGFGIKSRFEERWGRNWQANIISITKESDIVVGNLESPLLNIPLAHKKDFYGNPEFAYFLKESGIGILNIANNHIMEHGKRGYEETLKVLADTGIKVLGDNNRIIYLDKNGSRIALAGFCGVEQNTVVDGCSSVLNRENVFSTLDEMIINKADLKIFCFHWGNEYIHKPSMEQRHFAQCLIDAGADIIIGHHPHVIQPYEQYKNGHIFYSLGNFCFDNPSQSRQFSKGLGVTITYDTVKRSIGKISLFGVKLSLDNLVYKMPSSQFDSYFGKVQKEYQAIKSNKNYSAKYKKELAGRHFIERVLMKLSLIALYFSISSGERRMLLRNLIRYYLK